VTAVQLGIFDPPELADRPARDAATQRIDASFVVAAGAGAGKTETLIRRLECVLAAGGDPSRVAAITFTERAARDLVNKLRVKLPAHMTAAVEQVTVGTIHSFCLGILRRHPLEAGLPPVFSTQDELMAGTDSRDRALRIRHTMFERVTELDDARSDEVRQALDVLVAENGVRHVDLLIALIDRQWDRFDEVAFEPPPPWRDRCRVELQRIHELAGDGDVPLKLRVLIKDLLPTIDACLNATTMGALLDLLPTSTSLRSTGGTPGKAARDEVKARIGAARSIIHDATVRQLLHLLVPVVLEEAHTRYQSGHLSFDDILTLTRRLLVQHSEVRRRIRGELDHLCVDEFQDTDVVQYDIVRLLTDPDQTTADTTRPVLFAVGDPKQSIYGFRDADVGLFATLRNLAHVEPLQLTTNFRSRPRLLRWINATFGDWFAADQGSGQVPFAALDHHVADEPATVTVIGAAMDAPAERVARSQARDLARMIAAAHGSWLVRDGDRTRPAGYADVAVLVRTRADLVHLEPALRRAGIPYVIEGGALLYDTREVRDLLRVLTAVNDTASAIKVVNALRTSVLAISDVELVAHRNAGGPWSLYSRDDPSGHPAVLGALTMLRGWADARHRTPMPELLDQIARRTATHAASLLDGAPTTTWRRLRLVLDEARWWFEQTGGSLGEYLAWVAMRVDNDDRSNVTSDETDEDAVHILTVHAAKGLEFPIVMVAGLGRQRPTGELVRAGFGSDTSGARTISIKLGKLATEGFDSVDDRTTARLEAARLAYVACTRARDHLVVCMHHARRSSGCSAAEMAPYLSPTADVIDLPPPTSIDPPPMTDLSDRVDRPPARAIEWRVRSSWSATQLRHADDDAGVAIAATAAAVTRLTVEAAADSDARAPFTVASLTDAGSIDVDTDRNASHDTASHEEPSAVGDSVHSKPPRAFASLPDQVGRYGTRIGRAVHGVIQVLPFDDPLSPVANLVAQQCRAEDVPARFHPYVAQLVKSIVVSEVFSRMTAASRTTTVRREMYVGAEVNGEGIYGIIDAVWMEDGRFVVVDFKTDHVLEPPSVLADRYRAQLAAYTSALRAATDFEVAETLLCVARADGEPALTVPV
jgi:ATP-dependent helicase/nuclease subunit A